MPRSQRQEVFNVVLAQLLQERGVVAPESILYSGVNTKRQMPDVIVSYQGLRTAIEGEVEASKAKEKAVKSALGRVTSGIAHIGIGVVYPSSLRSVAFSELKRELTHANLEIAVVTEATELEKPSFISGDVDTLERVLRTTFDQLVREDVVTNAVAWLDAAVDRFAAAVLPYRGVWGRITQELAGDKSDLELDALSDEQRGANCRIGGLVLMNAMIFHDVLANHFSSVTPLMQVVNSSRIDQLAEDWQYILDNCFGSEPVRHKEA